MSASSPALEPRPPWPYSPSPELPQLITALLEDENGLVTGIWWSEALGNMSLPFGAAKLTTAQLAHIHTWMEHWLASEPHRFTGQGQASVRSMLSDIAWHQTQRIEQEKRRQFWETKDKDHLL